MALFCRYSISFVVLSCRHNSSVSRYAHSNFWTNFQMELEYVGDLVYSFGEGRASDAVVSLGLVSLSIALVLPPLSAAGALQGEEGLFLYNKPCRTWSAICTPAFILASLSQWWHHLVQTTSPSDAIVQSVLGCGFWDAFMLEWALMAPRAEQCCHIVALCLCSTQHTLTVHNRSTLEWPGLRRGWIGGCGWHLGCPSANGAPGKRHCHSTDALLSCLDTRTSNKYREWQL